MFITVDTVKAHLRQTFRKLGAKNAPHAVRIACDRDLFNQSAQSSCTAYATELIPALEEAVWEVLRDIRSRNPETQAGHTESSVDANGNHSDPKVS